MPRNKYPEETIARILQVSAQIFIKKGYENTTIQDIIDGLGGLTKGAIYHHFKNKEEIMLAVVAQADLQQGKELDAILHDTSLSGREKFQKFLYASLDSSGQESFFESAPDLIKSSKMLNIILKNTIEDTVPRYILPIIEQGIADGSLKVENPKETAEIFLLLANIWLNPGIFTASEQEMLNKLKVFQNLCRQMGLDVIDEKMFARLQLYHALYHTHKREDK